MQPFDALTLTAILHEAKPLLLQCKFEKVQQSGRDEIVLSLRNRQGANHLLLSAHPTWGRICLSKPLSATTTAGNFVQLLRKQLGGATLVGLEQVAGERIVDLVFSCMDELGSPVLRVLTAEIMGRHSNLIFWDKKTGKILGASHLVTADMSRQREIAPGLRYIRPPKQARPSLFQISKEDYTAALNRWDKVQPLKFLLVESFSGLGKNLAADLVQAAKYNQEASKQPLEDVLWQEISQLSDPSTRFAAISHDGATYTLLKGRVAADRDGYWREFTSTNLLVDEYYQNQEQAQRFKNSQNQQLQNLKSEMLRLETRLQAAQQQSQKSANYQEQKVMGDLILTHQAEVTPGQSELVCANLQVEGSPELSISLDPNLNAAQNAQVYYRRYAKFKARHTAAESSSREIEQRLSVLHQQLEASTQAESLSDLKQAEATLLEKQLKQSPQAKSKHERKQLLNYSSAGGFKIYAGRNRLENDELLSKVAQPQDIWLHVLGGSGSHVLIKVPSKQQPPASILHEAATLAAFLSRRPVGSKVLVAYTQCRFVRKIPGGKSGMVTYENEKTLEIKTTSAIPEILKKLTN